MSWKIVFLAVLISGPSFANRVIEGRVILVRDVDTIAVAGTPVRLNGLDGPETSTRIGREVPVAGGLRGPVTDPEGRILLMRGRCGTVTSRCGPQGIFSS